ncbi:MAG: endonuclease/exonuclease/phosphatase family protein [Oscillatoria sp. PMC 1068.18]|nr:endonuclease/exonuclease/phosphatase family protein [Oscillatoria sp. PMC 1076.18]MEC4987443.1 endonuclease/exonuclease/phosphatase family protein [Oscillatoria sp. PMC 1068.18]
MELKSVAKLKPQKFNREQQLWVEDQDNFGKIQQNQLKLVTFNVWYTDYYHQERAKFLLKIVKNCAADLIGFQEVTSSFLQLVLQKKWVRENYYISDSTGETVTPYGIILLSKFPIQQLTLYKLPSSMYRKLLVASLSINQESFQIGVVHLSSKKYCASRREKQLAEIFPAMENGNHAILMGDFNFCASWTEENAKIDRKYQDIWSVLRRDEPGYTEDTDINLMRLEQKGKAKQVRFDRILLRSSYPGWQANAIRLLGREPISAKLRNVFPSDHFGLSGKITYQTENEFG